MSSILSPDKQEFWLQNFIQETMDNFSMARNLANLIILYRNGNLPLPRATLLIEGGLTPVPLILKAETCGFLIVPVFRTAILDFARSIAFFGLRCDKNTGELKSITLPRRYDDDLGIEQFGLSLVTPDQFKQLASAVVSVEMEPILARVIEWRDKTNAHFTLSEPVIHYPEIRDVSKVMIEAYMQFVFDALGRSRPAINPAPA
jgi:hypothetical protein